jgi:para-aminobenzoate synthetase component I
VDLIRAAFPGGSITGCPKVRAMEIIDELEPCRRHLYCGSIGYISFHDTMDLSIAIRTATITGGTLCYSAGGGIVSIPIRGPNTKRPCTKPTPCWPPAQSASAQGSPEPVVWCNGRLACLPLPLLSRSPTRGCSTARFFRNHPRRRGRVPLLADHLARFNTTWRALMPSPPPDLTWAAIIDAVLAANHLQSGCAAVKILATRGSREAAPWDHTLLVTARAYTHRLAGKKSARRCAWALTRIRARSPLADHKTLNYLYYLRPASGPRPTDLTKP